MKKLAFLNFTLLMAIGASGFAGGGSTGGGESIILPKGDVKFLDLIPNETLPKEALTHEEVSKNFYSKHRYIKQLAHHDDQFFDCAVQRFGTFKDQYQAFARVIPVLSSNKHVLQVEFELGKIPSESSLGSFSLPYSATESPRTDGALQEPVAAFSSGVVWVSGRIYRAMNNSDQCGASVHEAFRQLNFSGIIVEPLTTTEVEIATRWITGNSFATDDLSQVLAKIKNTNLSSAEYSEKAKLESEQAAAMTKSLTDHQFTKDEETAYYTQFYNLIQQSNQDVLKGMRLNDSAIETAALGLTPEGIGMEVAATKKLPAFKYYDLLEMKIVTRVK